MKRRSQQTPKRDHERERLHKMTHMTLTEHEMRDRLIADKASLEAKLKTVFEFRKTMVFPKGGDGETKVNELIRGISAELRAVKAQL